MYMCIWFFIAFILLYNIFHLPPLFIFLLDVFPLGAIFKFSINFSLVDFLIIVLLLSYIIIRYTMHTWYIIDKKKQL